MQKKSTSYYASDFGAFLVVIERNFVERIMIILTLTNCLFRKQHSAVRRGAIDNASYVWVHSQLDYPHFDYKYVKIGHIWTVGHLDLRNFLLSLDFQKK